MPEGPNGAYAMAGFPAEVAREKRQLLARTPVEGCFKGNLDDLLVRIAQRLGVDYDRVLASNAGLDAEIRGTNDPNQIFDLVISGMSNTLKFSRERGVRE